MPDTLSAGLPTTSSPLSPPLFPIGDSMQSAVGGVSPGNGNVHNPLSSGIPASVFPVAAVTGMAATASGINGQVILAIANAATQAPASSSAPAKTAGKSAPVDLGHSYSVSMFLGEAQVGALANYEYAVLTNQPISASAADFHISWVADQSLVENNPEALAEDNHQKIQAAVNIALAGRPTFLAVSNYRHWAIIALLPSGGNGEIDLVYMNSAYGKGAEDYFGCKSVGLTLCQSLATALGGKPLRNGHARPLVVPTHIYLEPTQQIENNCGAVAALNTASIAAWWRRGRNPALATGLAQFLAQQQYNAILRSTDNKAQFEAFVKAKFTGMKTASAGTIPVASTFAAGAVAPLSTNTMDAPYYARIQAQINHDYIAAEAKEKAQAAALSKHYDIAQQKALLAYYEGLKTAGHQHAPAGVTASTVTTAGVLAAKQATLQKEIQQLELALRGVSSFSSHDPRVEILRKKQEELANLKIPVVVNSPIPQAVSGAYTNKANETVIYDGSPFFNIDVYRIRRAITCLTELSTMIRNHQLFDQDAEPPVLSSSFANIDVIEAHDHTVQNQTDEMAMTTNKLIIVRLANEATAWIKQLNHAEDSIYGVNGGLNIWKYGEHLGEWFTDIAAQGAIALRRGVEPLSSALPGMIRQLSDIIADAQSNAEIAGSPKRPVTPAERLALRQSITGTSYPPFDNTINQYIDTKLSQSISQHVRHAAQIDITNPLGRVALFGLVYQVGELRKHFSNGVQVVKALEERFDGVLQQISNLFEQQRPPLINALSALTPIGKGLLTQLEQERETVTTAIAKSLTDLAGLIATTASGTTIDGKMLNVLSEQAKRIHGLLSKLVKPGQALDLHIIDKIAKREGSNVVASEGEKIQGLLKDIEENAARIQLLEVRRQRLAKLFDYIPEALMALNSPDSEFAACLPVVRRISDEIYALRQYLEKVFKTEADSLQLPQLLNDLVAGLNSLSPIVDIIHTIRSLLRVNLGGLFADIKKIKDELVELTKVNDEQRLKKLADIEANISKLLKTPGFKDNYPDLFAVVAAIDLTTVATGVEEKYKVLSELRNDIHADGLLDPTVPLSPQSEVLFANLRETLLSYQAFLAQGMRRLSETEIYTIEGMADHITRGIVHDRAASYLAKRLTVIQQYIRLFKQVVDQYKQDRSPENAPLYHYASIFFLAMIGQYAKDLRNNRGIMPALVYFELDREFESLRWLRNGLMHQQEFDQRFYLLEYFANPLNKASYLTHITDRVEDLSDYLVALGRLIANAIADEPRTPFGGAAAVSLEQFNWRREVGKAYQAGDIGTLRLLLQLNANDKTTVAQAEKVIGRGTALKLKVVFAENTAIQKLCAAHHIIIAGFFGPIKRFGLMTTASYPSGMMVRFADSIVQGQQEMALKNFRQRIIDLLQYPVIVVTQPQLTRYYADQGLDAQKVGALIAQVTHSYSYDKLYNALQLAKLLRRNKLDEAAAFTIKHQANINYEFIASAHHTDSLFDEVLRLGLSREHVINMLDFVHLNARNQEGQTLLHRLCLDPNHYPVWLLDQVLARSPQLDIEDNDGNTPLDYAVEQHLHWIAVRLIEQGASCDLRASGNSALYKAVGKLNVATAEYMLARVPTLQINVRDKEGFAAIHYLTEIYAEGEKAFRLIDKKRMLSAAIADAPRPIVELIAGYTTDGYRGGLGAIDFSLVRKKRILLETLATALPPFVELVEVMLDKATLSLEWLREEVRNSVLPPLLQPIAMVLERSVNSTYKDNSPSVSSSVSSSVNSRQIDAWVKSYKPLVNSAIALRHTQLAGRQLSITPEVKAYLTEKFADIITGAFFSGAGTFNKELLTFLLNMITYDRQAQYAYLRQEMAQVAANQFNSADPFAASMQFSKQELFKLAFSQAPVTPPAQTQEFCDYIRSIVEINPEQPLLDGILHFLNRDNEEQAATNYHAILHLLARHGATAEAAYGRPNRLISPLHYFQDQPEIFAQLTQNTDNFAIDCLNYHIPNQPTGVHPLHIALQRARRSPHYRAAAQHIMTRVRSLNIELGGGGDTPLQIVIKANDVDMLRHLLAAGVDVNYKTHRFYSDVRETSLPILRLLAAHGMALDFEKLYRIADPVAQMDMRRFIAECHNMFVAVTRGDLAALQRLHTSGVPLVLVKAVEGRDGRTQKIRLKDVAIRHAQQTGATACIDYLRQHGVLSEREYIEATVIDLNKPGASEQYRQLFTLIKTDDLAGLQHFLRTNKSSINFNRLVSVERFYKDSILHLAIGCRSVEVARYLINQRLVDVDYPNKLGEVPLVAALEARSAVMVDLLMSQCPNLFPATGALPLAMDEVYQDRTLTNLILTRLTAADIANINAHYVLHRLAQYRNATAIKLLVSYGADVNQQATDSDRLPDKVEPGDTVLHIACRDGNTALVRILLEIPAVRANLHNTPLFFSGGCTPLHLAAANGNTDIGKLLLAHGDYCSDAKDHAAVNVLFVVTTGVLTPLELALENGHYGFAQLLVQHNVLLGKNVPILMLWALKHNDQAFLRVVVTKSHICDQDNLNGFLGSWQSDAFEKGDYHRIYQQLRDKAVADLIPTHIHTVLLKKVAQKLSITVRKSPTLPLPRPASPDNGHATEQLTTAEKLFFAEDARVIAENSEPSRLIHLAQQLDTAYRHFDSNAVRRANAKTRFDATIEKFRTGEMSVSALISAVRDSLWNCRMLAQTAQQASAFAAS